MIKLCIQLGKGLWFSKMYNGKFNPFIFYLIILLFFYAIDDDLMPIQVAEKFVWELVPSQSIVTKE